MRKADTRRPRAPRPSSVLLLVACAAIAVGGAVGAPNPVGAPTTLATTLAPTSRPPSFVLVLTDDQDVLLGGLSAMPFTQSLLRDQGATMANAFVDTPICCPSRTSTLSGLFGHNLGQQAVQNWCGNFTGRAIENATWVTRLHEGGYRTSMSGKYHNAPPRDYVPRGWDDFFSLDNECTYFNNSFNSNGTTVQYGDSPADYMTSLIGNRSLAFLAAAAASGEPFLAYIAPHASHMPATPAPWYADAPLPSMLAPRTPQYNASGEGKVWVIADQEPISPALEAGIDDVFRRRHRTLLSVDDIVRDVVAALGAAGRLDDTYIMFTSDHGYNLGTFRMPVEKFHLLESDIRVPFLVRGPGVPANSTNYAIISNVDIGATILDLAGLPPAATPTDGRSFADALRAPGAAPRRAATPGHRSAAGRDRTIIEYGRWGTGYVVRGACGVGCGICSEPLSRLVDAPSNTYAALRIINASHSLMYAEFAGAGGKAPQSPSATNFTELYDLNADEWQLNNLALDPASAPLVAQLSAELWAVALCKGAECP